MMDDVVADAAEERTSNGVETSRADHDQLSLLGVSDAHDALTGVLERRLTANLVLYLHTTTTSPPSVYTVQHRASSSLQVRTY